MASYFVSVKGSSRAELVVMTSTWLNGPAEGTYGFTVGQFAAAFGDHGSKPATPLTRDQLVQEVREFVKAFYEPGGMGDDFPDHVPARTRPSTSP